MQQDQDPISQKLAIIISICTVVAVAFIFSAGLINNQQIKRGNQRESGQVTVETTRPELTTPPLNLAAHACPICLGDPEHSCTTQCGHNFCTSCIIRYWRMSPTRRILTCPCCRSLITLLIPDFALNFEQIGLERNVSLQRRQDIDEYNGIYALETTSSFLEIYRNVPRLIRAMTRHFRDEFSRD
jgi:hypothetical protein